MVSVAMTLHWVLIGNKYQSRLRVTKIVGTYVRCHHSNVNINIDIVSYALTSSHGYWDQMLLFSIVSISDPILPRPNVK